MKTRGWLLGLLMAACAAAQPTVAGFEDVNVPAQGVLDGSDGSGGWWSGPAFFANLYDSTFGSWEGFAVSRLNDPTVKGWAGQFNAITGAGLLGSPTYGVCYQGFSTAPTIRLASPAAVEGLYLTNNTYAYYSMAEGDLFSKRFGGADGNDPDWFKVTITGWDANETATGSVEAYLADYRPEDPNQDRLLDHWTFVDLRSLGTVAALTFSLASTDNGDWGMNTPAYCVIDQLLLEGAAPYRSAGIPGFDPADASRVHPIFRGWATGWVDYQPAVVQATYADPARALGPVTGDNTDVVSLGEAEAADQAAGRITLVFGDPNDPNDPAHIRDDAGADFVVFENGFESLFDVDAGGSVAGQLLAELAYVEVSTNGVDFARFENLSLVDEPVGPYGTLDPNRVAGLAGQHPNAYGVSLGTPFDLSTLRDHEAVRSGRVDLQDIRYVRLVDIPGDGRCLDSADHPIYDAWPTVGSGGFDLEAVGVLWPQTLSGDLNRDGWVDQADVVLLQRQIGRSAGDSGWLRSADLDGNGHVDEQDLALLQAQLGQQESWRS